MSDNVEVDVEVSGWTPEQTAFVLFNRAYSLCHKERPQTVEGVLTLYAKCLSVVRHGDNLEFGRQIGDRAGT